MIRWMLDPEVVCWSTDSEYRVVDGEDDNVVLAVCDTRPEAEQAQAALATAVTLTEEERAALRRCRLSGPKHERAIARAVIDRLIGPAK